MLPSISVLIRTFNSGRTLDDVLSQLSLSAEDECIVVDSGSTDSTHEIAARHKARIIEVDPPFHYSRSLNEGFEAAMGDWVLVLSSHCIPLRKDFLTRMRQIAATVDEDIAVVYGRTALFDPGVICPEIINADYDDWKSGRFMAGGNGIAMYPKKYWVMRHFKEDIRTAEDLDWLAWALQAGFRACAASDAIVIYRNQGGVAYMFKKGWHEVHLANMIHGGAVTLRSIRSALRSLVVNSLHLSKALILGRFCVRFYMRMMAHGLGSFLAGLTYAKPRLHRESLSVKTKVAILAQFPFDALEGPMEGRAAGQAATWLPQLAASFEGSDLDIHWCVLGHKVRSVRVVKKWGQTFHLIPSPGISVSMILCRWPQHLAFTKLLGTLKPDLIHCWGTENLFGAGLRDFHGPSILSMQGVVHAIHRTGDLKGWRWTFFRHWEEVSIAKASVVTAESQWGLDQVRKIAPSKAMRKIEYGVSQGYYQVEWKPQPSEPRIFFAGGLNRLKGVDILVEMLKRYPSRPWKMVFAGDGYLREELLALNDPSVQVLGVLKTSEVQEQMSKAWALVHPSRADTSPNVVKEARVIGLPVIGSPHGGHAEYIEHGKDGYLVETENPEEWFNALAAICRDFEACTAMGAANHGWFRQHFRPEKTAEEFLELYAEMIG